MAEALVVRDLSKRFGGLRAVQAFGFTVNEGETVALIGPNGAGKTLAKEALDRIGQLYRVEESINGAAPDHRRRERQQRSKPIAEALAACAEDTVRRPRIAAKQGRHR